MPATPMRWWACARPRWVPTPTPTGPPSSSTWRPPPWPPAMGQGTEGGMDLALDTVRRLACGCRSQLVAESADGVVRLGRTTRTPPPWLERQVRRRDQGCRFSGCGRRRWTQVHHIAHWTAGGHTDLDNLIELCWEHHHAVHEGGWSIRGDPNHRIVVVAPGGDPRQTGPPPLRDDVRRRLFGDDAQAA